jgi:hypothetical protein
MSDKRALKGNDRKAEVNQNKHRKRQSDGVE